MESQLVKLKTKKERKKDIEEEIIKCVAERQRITVEYQQNIKRLDKKHNELERKLLSGDY